LDDDGSGILVVRHNNRAPRLNNPIQAPERQRALASSAVIGCDSSRIQALAAEAIGAIKEVGGDANEATLQKAQKLEAFVNRYIERKDYSQLLLNAEQVAEQRCGDCTEHAVLLAALCRAAKIPTRVVIGLVHVPSQNGFVFHMWNESLIEDTWIALDATLGQGGIGVGHIKINNGELSDGSDWSDFLPILSWMGEIEIELVDVER